MWLTVNGKPFEAAEEGSMHDLLAGRAVNEKSVIVELNGQIIPAERFKAVLLHADDRLEIIRILGGG